MADHNTTSSSSEVNPEYSQKWWVDLIDQVEKEMDRRWRDSGDKIVNRYLDDRTENDAILTTSVDVAARYNIFWANVQIMKSALYATPPKPGVTRQNGDAKDDVARTAALMLERMLTIDVNKDTSDMHAAFKHGVEDRLIPGMGQVWLRYDVETDTREVAPAQPGGQYDPVTGSITPPTPAITKEVIVKESAPCDYVHWRDFLWSPARTWEEVWWVARRVWMKKKSFIKRFGQEKYDELKGNYDQEQRKGKGGPLPKGFAKGRVEVFEVWCEDTNKVYFVNRYCDDLLQTVDDPLRLDDFFPCPKPLFATHTTSNLFPRADYTMCQDQYQELDVLNDRIVTLTRALRVVGVYDKQQAELSKLLTGPEFAMVAVDNWAMLAEKGGLKNSVDWFPVEQVAQVLEKLMVQRQSVIGQIYELTSISDIMRGASNARETAKAQTLKAQYSSVRLQLTQQDVARWVMHAMKIKAEIIGRHFQPHTIVEQSQIMMTESAQFAEPAVALIKDFDAAQYRIEVGEETLSIADYTAEREQRTEYLTAVGQFLSQAGQIVAGNPDAMPFLLKMVQWVTASFRSSSDIESVLDDAIRQASQPKPQQDPAAAAKAAEEAKGQVTMQIEQGKAQAAAATAKMQEESKQAIVQLQETTKKEIAQMQIQSAQDIAAANNETKMALETMKAELTSAMNEAKLAGEEGKQQMTAMLERMRMVHEAMLVNVEMENSAAESEAGRIHESEQAGKVEDKAEKPDTNDKFVKVLEQLAEAINRPKRKRVTARDAKGNIQEVEEI